MSDIEYFSTFDESVEIIRSLIGEGLSIIVEPELVDAPRVMMFRSVDADVARILERAPGFYISGPFTRHNISFTQLTEGAARGKYFINALAGGPILQCQTARIDEVDGSQCLLPGNFSYQDAYRNPDTGEWEKPTAELKEAFRRIAALVRSRCPPFALKAGAKVFISPQARTMLETKAVTIAAG